MKNKLHRHEARSGAKGLMRGTSCVVGSKETDVRHSINECHEEAAEKEMRGA